MLMQNLTGTSERFYGELSHSRSLTFPFLNYPPKSTLTGKYLSTLWSIEVEGPMNHRFLLANCCNSFAQIPADTVFSKDRNGIYHLMTFPAYIFLDVNAMSLLINFTLITGQLRHPRICASWKKCSAQEKGNLKKKTVKKETISLLQCISTACEITSHEVFYFVYFKKETHAYCFCEGNG